MVARSRRARLDDVHELAMRMPYVTVWQGSRGNPIYQVGGKSFVFFRNPRPNAVDPATGQRYPDVIVFWALSESDKQALVQDQASPFFTTSHFDGHPSVLVRGSRICELTVRELAEVTGAPGSAKPRTPDPRPGSRRTPVARRRYCPADGR